MGYVRLYRKSIVRIVILLLIFCIGAPCSAAAMQTKTVKVAYWERGERFETTKDGLTGYDVELIEKIGEQGDYHIEYVKAGSPEEAVQMLDSGEADLVTSMVKTPEREKKYIYSDTYTGITFSGLITLSTRTELIYQDTDSINKCVIGYEGKSGKTDEYKSYIENTYNEAITVPYDSITELREALHNGDIDVMATGANNVADEEKLIDLFGPQEVYYIAAKENSKLIREINRFISELLVRKPSYLTDLQQEYFPMYYTSNFNKEEIDYIQNCKVIKVGVPENRKPISWYDRDEKQFKGIIIDKLGSISEKSNLKFEYMAMQEGISVEEAVKDNQYDILAPVIGNEYYSGDTEVYITTGFQRTIVNLAIMNDKTIDKDDEIKIGIANEVKELKGILSQQYENADIKVYESQNIALKAMKNGEIDAMANTDFVWYYLRQIPLYSNVKILPDVSMDLSYCIIGAKEHNDKKLFDVMNIAIDNLEKSDGALVQYTTGIIYEKTLIEKIGESMPIILIAILIILCILTYTIQRNKYYNQLRDNNKKLEKAVAAKSEFLARMSHDMRTPMNVILGLTDIALSNNELSDEMNDHLKKIKGAGDLLLSQINDILDISKIENELLELKLENYELEEFMEQMEILIQPLCDAKDITFKVDKVGEVIPAIYTDKVRFNQIFFNLLTNAAKFTKNGGKVTLTIKEINKSEDTVVNEFIVEDNGIGMSQEFQQHMFEPFIQEHSELENDTPGTGLGLSIVNSLVELMKGSISVESKLGEGSKFIIRLTNKIGSPVNKHKETITDIQLSNLKDKVILVCEDHPINREIAKKILEMKGMKVLQAENGKEGVDIFAASGENEISAILMDIRMPEMNGIEATKCIRALNRKDAATVPIIAMTANAFAEDKRNTKQAGMNEHLSKPIEPKLLLKVLSEYMAHDTID